MTAWIVLTSCAHLVLGAGRITLHEDGSVAVPGSPNEAEAPALLLRFGLPRVPPSRMWREGEVLRGIWMTNGVRYTQTILLSASSLETGNVPGPALLVQIEGENTQSEYAEGFAELSVEIGQQRLQLELTNGLVWSREGLGNRAVCVLEIPESGVKQARGEVLRFSGSIPPSLKGSMTVKLPLLALADTASWEHLQDVDFDRALRRARTPPSEALAGEGRQPLILAEELKEDGISLPVPREKPVR